MTVRKTAMRTFAMILALTLVIGTVPAAARAEAPAGDSCSASGPSQNADAPLSPAQEESAIAQPSEASRHVMYYVRMMHPTKDSPSMSDVLFHSIADVYIRDQLAVLQFYAVNPVPAFPDNTVDGTVKDAVITYNGQQYHADSDLTTKPVMRGKSSALFGLRGDESYPMQILTVTLPEAALSEPELFMDYFENVVMKSDNTVRIVLTLISDGFSESVLAVEKQIADLGEITLNSETAIADARMAYANLSGPEREHVSNLSVLTAAEAKLKQLQEQALQIQVDSVNMTLGNELAMNFMVKKADVPTLNGLSLKITKTFADGRRNVSLTVPAQRWRDYNEYYAVTFDDISAKEMTDSVTAVVLKDGKPAGEVYTDSVADYALRVLRGENASIELKHVIVDLLNYGTEAQKYFRYNLDAPANAALNDAEKSLASEPLKVHNEQIRGEKYFGSNLNLGNSTTLTLYFKGITPDMYAILAYTGHNGESMNIRMSGVRFVPYNDTVSGVPVDTLVVADAQQPVTVTVYDANHQVVASGTDSIASYVSRSSSIGELGRSILKLASSAEVYFTNR